MDEIKIQAEPKDDQTCRFTVDKPVYPDGSIYFGAKAQAAGSPLAEKLFAIDTVESVMVQDSVVTVSRPSGADLRLHREGGAYSQATSGARRALRVRLHLYCFRHRIVERPRA